MRNGSCGSDLKKNIEFIGLRFPCTGTEGMTEILDGLNEGDLVITAGYQELNDGQAISGEWMKGN